MSTQYHRSPWPRNRSWSPAEENTLLDCLIGGVNYEADAHDMKALAKYFRRKVGALKQKIQKLGYDVPFQGHTGRPRKLTEEQVEVMSKLYPLFTLQEIAALATVRYGTSVGWKTIRKYLAEAGMRIERAGRRAG